MKYIINDVVVNKVNNEMILIIACNDTHYYFYYLCPCKSDISTNFAFISNVNDSCPISMLDNNDKIDLVNF